MYFSESELYTALILLVSAVKTIWDIWASSAVFAHRSKEKSGRALTKEVKAKHQRDGLSSLISFAAIVIFAGMIIEDGAAKKELIMEEFELLDKKVKVLESHFIPPGGESPANFHAMLNILDVRLSNLENTDVSKEDIKKLKKDADDLKKLKAKIEKAKEYEKQLRIQGDVSIL